MKKQLRTRSITRKVFGWVAKTLSVLFILWLLLALVLIYGTRIPAVSRYVTSQVNEIIATNVNPESRVDALMFHFPYRLGIHGVYLQDQQSDTLVFAREIIINIRWTDLLRKKINVDELRLQGANVNLLARGDTGFNYSFLLPADSAATPPQPKKESSWTLTAGEVLLADVRFRMRDQSLDLVTTAGKLEVGVDELDLAGQHIGVDYLEGQGIDVRLHIAAGDTTTTQPDTISTAISPWSFAVGALEMGDVTCHISSAGSFDLSYRQTGLMLANARVDLEQSIISTELLTLATPQVSFTSMASPEASATSADSKGVMIELAGGWQFNVSELDLADGSVKFLDLAKKSVETESDPPVPNFSDFAISDLSLRLADVQWSDAIQRLQVHALTLRSDWGVSIEESLLSVSSENQKLQLDTLHLRTNTFAMDARVSLASRQEPWMLAPLSSKLDQLDLQVELSTDSLMTFLPAYRAIQQAYWPIASTALSVSMSGDSSQLDISKLVVSGRDRFLSFQTHLRHPLDPSQLVAQWRIDSLFYVLPPLQAIVDTSQFRGWTLPDTILLSGAGRLGGGLAVGQINVRGDLTQGSIDYRLLGESVAKIDSGSVALRLDPFDLGALLDNPQLGASSILARAQFVRPMEQDRVISAKLEVPRLVVRDTLYRNLTLGAALQGDHLEVDVAAADKGFDLALLGTWDLAQSSGTLHGELAHLDLQKLGVMDSSYDVGMVLRSEFQVAPWEMFADLDLKNISITASAGRYTIDSLVAHFQYDSTHTDLEVQSDLLMMTFRGSITPQELEPVLRRHFEQYRTFQEQPTNTTSQEEFSVVLDLRRDELIPLILLPQIDSLDFRALRFDYRGQDNLLTGRLSIPQISLEGVGIRDIDLDLQSNQGLLKYLLNIDHISYKEDLALSGMVIQGDLNPEHGFFDLTIADSLRQPRYQLQIEGTFLGDTAYFQLANGRVIINGDTWQAPPNHLAWQTKEGWGSRDFKISHEEEELGFSVDSLFTLHMKDFRLSNFTSLPDRIDSLYLVTGIIDGSLSYPNRPGIDTFPIAQVAGKDLTWSGTDLGSLGLILEQQGRQLAFRADHNMDHNHAQIAGAYYDDQGDPNLEIGVHLDVDSLKDYQAFTEAFLADLHGRVTGDFQLSYGNAVWKNQGKIAFIDVGGEVVASGVRVVLPREEITFDNRGIVFDNFRVQNHKNHTAVLDGHLVVANGLRWDLELDTDRFWLLDNGAQSELAGRGVFSISSDARVSGSLYEVSVTGNFNILEDTDVLIELPAAELELVDEEGVVEWVDTQSADSLVSVDAVGMLDSIGPRIPGVSIKTRIGLSPKAKFVVLVNPASGDRLTIRGESSLLYSQDPLGNRDLTGLFEVKQGSYELLFYGLVKKNFQIQEGSSIRWTGDIERGEVDIKAIYESSASPLKLLSEEAGALSDAEKNSLQQRMPFRVELNIGGSISAPEISFGLTLPASDRRSNPLIASKLDRLAQPDSESERYQQVFALLVLGDFVPVNPDALGTGGNFATTAARNTVSNILTQQLNSLSSQYVKSFDLEVGLNSYETADAASQEARTEVDIQLRKQLLNDRLTIEVGSRFDLGGDEAITYSGNSGIPEFAVIYQLTPTGSYRIRAFREQSFDIVDGQVQDTGLSLLFVRDIEAKGQRSDKGSKQRATNPKPKSDE